MALPFPNVPNVPGVPPIPRDPLSIAASIILLAQDAFNFFSGSGFPQWGIFSGGAPVVVADSVVSFGFKNPWTISDYPLEQGAFESYDKVASPFEIRIRFATGGNSADRQAFLRSIEAIAGTLNLYDVNTPDAAYPSCNITNYSYDRSAINGVGLLVVDVWLVQVRVTATQAFSNTANPSAASPQSIGQVSAVPSTKAVATMFGGTGGH